MDRWKPYLNRLSEHKNMIKAAAVALVLLAAVVFFGGFGEESDNSINVEAAQAQTETESSMEGAETDAAADTAASMGPVYVDIGGCVKKPGVYQVVEGTRLFEVIKAAGGLTPEADVSQINQAETVTDGQKVVIPAIGEGGQAEGRGEGDDSAGAAGGITADGRVNINKADSTQLQELPGVGPATAEKILDYREANGAFQSPEEIKNVSGIGDKTYEKMKDKICV